MRSSRMRMALLALLGLGLPIFALAFGGQAGIPVGDHPRSLAVGDFNRDGWDDIAVVNELSNDITILICKDGKCEPKVDAVKYDAYRPIIPMAIAVGDLHNDGKVDLALAACGLTEVVTTTTKDGEVTTKVVYRNVFTYKGDGRGGFKIDKRYQAGDCPSAVTMADLDRDGKLELVVANSGSDDITVIDSTKLKFFKVHVTPVALAVGDFNRDGKLDLAVACSGSDEVCILLGTGDSKYLEEELTCFTVGRRPLDLGVGDFNRDNILDLAVANSDTNDVWTLFGDGTGKFTMHKRYRVDQAPSALVVQDFNRDGRLDIAVANALANDVWVLSGRPEGEFEAVAGKFAVGDRPVAIASGDFDAERDEYPDLAVANELTNDVTILLGIGAGRFSPLVMPPPNQPPVADFTWTPQKPQVSEEVTFDASGSYDPDGKIVDYSWDFGDGTTGTGKVVKHTYAKEDKYEVCLTVRDDRDAEGSTCKEIEVVPPPGPTPTPPTPTPPPPSEATKTPGVGQGPSGIASGDFNTDGKEDLAVIAQGSNDVSILLGTGEGKFALARTVEVGQSPQAIIAADLDEDGQLDLAVANAASNDVSVLLGDGKGGFLLKGSYPVAGSNPTALEVGDLDGDGKLDLVVANSGSNNVSVLLGSGDGALKEALLTEEVGDSPEGLALGDLDGDGKLDLVVANLNSNDVAVLLGKGDGTFTLGQRVTGFTHPREVLLEDLDGDGKLDLAVTDTDANVVVVLLGKGDGTFSEERIPAKVGESPRALSAGDLDRDGHLDLAVANYSSNDVTILLGRGDGSFVEGRAHPVGEKPAAVAIGEFNLDENLDLAVANYGSNDVTILLGRGDGSFEDPQVGFLRSAWSGLLIGGVGSLILFPALLKLWGMVERDRRKKRLDLSSL